MGLEVKEVYLAAGETAKAGGAILKLDKEKVCILGANEAEEIFGNAIEAYGSVLYIGQRLYVVDGVLKAMGTVASGISPDDAVFVLYATGIKYLTAENINPDLTILAEDVDKTDEVISEAEALKLFHRLDEMGNTIILITHDLEVTSQRPNS